MSELLPCPFCGNTPVLVEIEPHSHAGGIADFMPDHPGSAYIDCACGVGCIDATKEAVAERWNMRAASPSAAQQAGEPVAWQFRQRSAIGRGPQSSLPWCDWCGITREDYEKYVREPNKLVQVRALYAAPVTEGVRASEELEIQPRGGMTFNWQEQSLLYQKRLRALMKLVAEEGYAVSSDGRTGMPYALSRFRDEPEPSKPQPVAASAVEALETIARTTFSGDEMGDEYQRGNRDAHATCARMARAALTAARDTEGNRKTVNVENLSDWFYDNGHEFVVSNEEDVARALIDSFDILPKSHASMSSTQSSGQEG